MKEIKCPCKDCLLIVLCKHKLYIALVEGCSLLKNYLYTDNTVESSYRVDQFGSRVHNVNDSLQTDKWFIDGLGNMNSFYVTIHDRP